ncbi:MAG: S8/S53 family peptidase [Synergistaceae bacterium]
MKKSIILLSLTAMLIVLSGCITQTPVEYSFNPGPPPSSVRTEQWEGFGAPAAINSTDRRTLDTLETESYPKVLWVIADTYGNSKEMDSEWASKVPRFFDPERLSFVEPEGTPNTEQHWHGFSCYSRGWPLLYSLENVNYVLFRMVDVDEGQDALIIFLEQKLKEYNGRVVVSCSWGVPPQGDSYMDDLYASIWTPWAEKMDKLAVDYPSFSIVFSSGNSGPSFSGVPQRLMTNAILVGATSRLGYIAEFSSQANSLFCVAGGHRTYVADPSKAGEYMIVSGTSFSCPTVAAMIVKLLAENPEWDRAKVLNFLSFQIVPSIDAKGFNTVWGKGELEQFNQTVPLQVWRDLGYPNGLGARVKNFVTPTRLIELPEPKTKLP